MITKELGKKILLYILGLVVVTLIALPLFIHTNQDKDNQLTLQRLDEISQRLSKIGLEIEDISIQIQSLEEQKDTLIKEQTELNDEASALFLGLVTPEMIEPKEEITQTDSVQTEWQPGQLTEDQSHQEMPQVSGDDSHQRFKNLMLAYGLDPSQIRSVENHYGIKEGVIGCITVAETSGGNRGAGGKNIGSVGSNDRGDRPTYALMETGLEDIGKTLVNRYLGSKQTLGCLSNAGSCAETSDNGKRYATSTSNWELNMKACLEIIYGEGNVNPSTFNIRR